MKYTYVTVILFCFASYNSAMVTEADFQNNKPISLTELKASQNFTNSPRNSGHTKHKKSDHSSTEFSNTMETPNRSSGESQSPDYNSYRLDRLGEDARKQSFHPSAIGFLREDSDLDERRELLKNEFKERYKDHPEYIKFIEFIENETNTLFFDIEQIKKEILESEKRISESLKELKDAENRGQQKTFWGGLSVSLTLIVIGASNLAVTFLTCGE